MQNYNLNLQSPEILSEDSLSVEISQGVLRFRRVSIEVGPDGTTNTVTGV